MSIDNWQIQVELRTQLLTVPGIPGEDHQAWENRTFEPTSGEPWIREQLMPGNEDLTANEEIRGVGVCQYDYFVPIGHSIKEAKGVADDIKNAFPPATVLGGLVRIDASRVLPGSRGVSGYVSESSSSPWYQLPVQIDYTVFSIT